jgi:dsDNA-specific endonuclease/ATPase MutS2
MSIVKAIKMYDHVRMKDGRTGHVVEIYDMPDLSLAYEIEVDHSKMELVTVQPDDITDIIK